MKSVNVNRAADYSDATRALRVPVMTDLLAILTAELAARQPCLEIGVGTGRIALPLYLAGITMAGARQQPPRQPALSRHDPASP